MPKMKRTYKTLAVEERAERERELALIEAERPELDKWANDVLDRVEEAGRLDRDEGEDGTAH